MKLYKCLWEHLKFKGSRENTDWCLRDIRQAANRCIRPQSDISTTISRETAAAEVFRHTCFNNLQSLVSSQPGGSVQIPALCGAVIHFFTHVFGTTSCVTLDFHRSLRWVKSLSRGRQLIYIAAVVSPLPPGSQRSDFCCHPVSSILSKTLAVKPHACSFLTESL